MAISCYPEVIYAMTSDSCFVVKQPHGYTIPTLQKEVIEVNPHSSGERGRANPFLKKKLP